MDVKDYYGILQLEPSASLVEIKQAYRKLAKELHPDKNSGNAYAAAQFSEVKEAYEVLTDPAKKEYYLQRRWYNQSIGKRKKQEIVTPVTTLQLALELDRYVASLDIFRMDKNGLKDYILSLIPDETIDKLKPFNEPAINQQITEAILRAAKPLPHQFIGDISKQLNKLAENDEEIKQLVDQFVAKETKRYRREKFSLLIIIFLTAAICFIIWLAGR